MTERIDIFMGNPSKKTLKHMARVALNQNDPYNPINRDIRKWEKKSPKLAARERFCFFYYYNKMLRFARESKKGNGQVG